MKTNIIKEDAGFKGDSELKKIEDEIKILFVGYNNVMRSPMAEFVMKNIVKQAGLSGKISVASSGYGKKCSLPMSDYTKYELTKHEIPFKLRQTSKLTKLDCIYNYIIAMDSYDKKNISKIVGKENKEKIFLLMDFAGEHRDVQYIYNTYEDIEIGCKALMEKIQTSFNL